MSQDDHMTASEVAAQLGRSLATVKRDAKKGKLPVALKVPGRTGAYLFRRSDIEALTTERSAS